MSDSIFKKARAGKDFVQGVNDDVKPIPVTQATQTIKTKNSKGVTIEPNNLSHKERSRAKVGRNLGTMLFVEELEVIEQTVEKMGDISLSNFIRQTLLDKCQSVLGDKEYNATLANKRNVIKSKDKK